MFTLSRIEARNDSSTYQKSDMVAHHHAWAVVLPRIMLAIVLVSHVSRAICEESYPSPEEINAPPANLPPFDENLSDIHDPTAADFDNLSTLHSSPSEPSIFSASLDPMMVDESGTVTVQDIEKSLLPQASIQGFFAQIDYFYWIEATTEDPIEESGPLLTLGYQARKPDRRYRLAMFFGNVDFESDFFSSEDLKVASSGTDYLGGLFEYDFRWRFPGRPTDGVFAGIGARLWSRTIDVSWDTPMPWLDGPSMSMRQIWWTVYPRVGFDINRTFGNGWHLYSSSSLGFTAYTSAKFDTEIHFLGEVIFEDSITVEPKCGFYGHVELSLRKNRMFLSLMIEQFGWRDSDPEENLGQTDSYMLTAGLLTGFVF